MASKPKGSKFVRARGYATRHPWITWGTAASIASVLAILGSFGYWVTQQVQTPKEAEKESIRILAIIENNQKANRITIDANHRENRVTNAWQSNGIVRVEKLVVQLMNAGCKSKDTPDCEMVRDQYKEVQERSRETYRAAQQASKEK